MKRALFLALFAGCCAAPACAQVVINEVYLNPPGSGANGDDRWEYLEIMGPANMDLTGYMVCGAFGGADDGDNIPGPLPGGFDVGDELAEIDEAWSLDGLHLGSNGLLVLYNSNGGVAKPSFIPALLPAATSRATFIQAHIPGGDVAGRIKNDGSATFVLLRKRPAHSINAAGQSVYGAGYDWRKDVNQDVDFDGQLDFGGAGTLLSGGPRPAETPVQSQNPGTPAVGAPGAFEPYQMVDDVAWSNAGGREYTRSKQQEITDTAGFNPDAVSRIAYYGSNPHHGSVFTAGVMSDSHTADEEWIYGDVPSTPELTYDPTLSGGPTDQSGPHYNAMGQLDAAGTYLLNDINRTGFKLTPGQFNDVDSSASGGINIVQTRMVRGDFNFDGVVDCDDLALIAGAVGDSLDATYLRTDGNGTSTNSADDFTITSWTYEGRDFNALLAMVRMSLTDGSTGEWNSGVTVTQDDLDAFHSEFSLSCCPADFDGDGTVDFFDYDSFVICFEGGACPPGKTSDFDGDGSSDFFDYDAFVVAFESPC